MHFPEGLLLEEVPGSNPRYCSIHAYIHTYEAPRIKKLLITKKKKETRNKEGFNKSGLYKVNILELSN